MFIYIFIYGYESELFRMLYRRLYLEEAKIVKVAYQGGIPLSFHLVFELFYTVQAELYGYEPESY